MKYIYFLLFWIFLYACHSTVPQDVDKSALLPVSNLSGSELATIHCGRCHSYVEPEMLPKASWEEDVLPAMAYRMGIYKGEHQPDSLFDEGLGGDLARKANIYPEEPILSRGDWEKIIDFYVSNAPDTIMPPKANDKLNTNLALFKYKVPKQIQPPALTTMVKILPNQQGLVYSEGRPQFSNLNILNPDLELTTNLRFKTTPIDFRNQSDTLYITTLGKSVFPHDAPEGDIQKVFKQSGGEVYNGTRIMIPDLHRPVDIKYCDLNNDGLEDVLACEYGNNIGQLTYYENKGGETYEAHVLSPTAGAISTVVKDLDGDGYLDVVALMAQGDESIVYYKNMGDNTFTAKPLLRFSPLNGSQYIEMADFNGDGLEDILYVCGDNADKTPILKPYHGVYIFLNTGDFSFVQEYFYPLNGAYKAMARDYDEDGDLDIAAISFFPDYVSQAQQSFVFLENQGEFAFDSYTFPQSTDGRWMVMDAGDIDGDGDIDLALGSFVFFQAMGDTTGLGQKWMRNGPAIVVLENTTKP